MDWLSSVFGALLILAVASAPFVFLWAIVRYLRRPGEEALRRVRILESRLRRQRAAELDEKIREDSKLSLGPSDELADEVEEE